MSSDLQNKLRGLKAMQSRRPAHGSADKGRRTSVPEAAPGAARGFVADTPPESERLAQMLGASVGRNTYGEHLVSRRWFPVPGELELRAETLALLDPRAAKEVADPEQWLFLDTETTGMAGGTGTYAFLVGIAWWDAGGIEVEQFFMRDYNEEHSVLLALAERLAERRVLVTFNGKSFDWPLLETRYRLTRSITPGTLRGHLDLLHAARTLWRPRLGSVRLVELERHVLGLDRGPDVMSELIPQMYFDFVRGGAADGLARVARHNQMDLVGLAALAVRVFALLGGAESLEGDALDVYGVSRLLDRRGQAARARKLYQRALGDGLPEEAERSAQHQLARLAKRDGDFPQANALWEELCGESREGLKAYEELAMYYEHRARQPDRAAELVRDALRGLHQARRAGTIKAGFYRSFAARLEHRLTRLAAKSGNFLLLDPE